MRTGLYKLALTALGGLLLLPGVYAQTRTYNLNFEPDPRGKPELIVCSQNLANLGNYNLSRTRDPSLSPEDFELKKKYLAARIMRNKCDVVAVQEVLGKTLEIGKSSLEELSSELKKRFNRNYEALVGPSNDKYSRLGFLLATDRATISNTLSYARVELPRISEEQKQREFARGPFELQISVKPRGDTFAKTVTLINYHFKSKRGKAGDPTNLEWETYRMEMAEALRRVVENRHSESFGTGETILVVLGDRNAHLDVASTRVLEGKLTLAHFQGDGVCRLSERGVPLCQVGVQRKQTLFSVFAGNPLNTARGTYKYRGVYSWIDDIMLPAESLRFAWNHYGKPGEYASGIDQFGGKDASDHAMAWVALNW